MNDLLKYKNYYGSVKYSAEDRVFHGKIEFINDLVTFEATDVESLEAEFRAAVDDYFETCKELGIKPQKAFKGQFNVRVKPDIHRKAALVASLKDISLNRLVEIALEHEISSSVAVLGY